MPTPAQQLQSIATFADLVRYLEDELDWPLHDYGFDELTFEYLPAELGLKEADAAKVKAIHQLRPLQHGQPWGIFFVEFERKKLPVVVLRRILSHLVVKKRAAANRADAAAWHAEDLLFIAAYGDDAPAAGARAGAPAGAPREIAFAHFHQEAGDLPTLRVLGWDGADTPLKLEHVAATLRARLQWPADPQDQAAWRSQWSSSFRHRPGHVITTADALAEALARLARQIRLAALTLLAHESEQGALRSLHKAFQTALIHDLSEADFADTYAQTITYGLLTAAINRTDRAGGRGDTTLYTNMLTEVVPVTNPFLREMLQAFLNSGGPQTGIDFDELGIQDVVELLRGEETDLPAILRDFGNKTQGEDPVIHFYEHFLTAYDKALKVKRGVFYTPQPVVAYIVRSVDELLRSEFGLEDGLASTVTWGELAQRIPGLAIPKGTAADSPFVVVLDPATGTATFLVEVIDVIHRTLMEKWRRQGLSAAQRQAAWNEYVPQHLLPRLYGYELMMAPYAIAHMKIGLKLHETGYRFGSDARVRVYLTNALAPADDVQQTITGVLPALAHEAAAVNLVKRNVRFTVVTGNPPYSGHSANKGAWILNLVADYKRGYPDLQKPAQAKWLQDDYVKFVRLGQYLGEQTGLGILAMITNHGYLDNPTFRGMRQQLMKSCSEIRIIDLHGNTKKRESALGGAKDENVFDIQQGVAIGLMVKSQNGTSPVSVFHSQLHGDRTFKYQSLAAKSVRSSDWAKISPQERFYLFIPQNRAAIDEYERGWRLPDALNQNGSPAPGIITTHDEFAISWDAEGAADKVVQFLRTQTEEQARQLFRLCSQSQWDYHRAKNELASEDWRDQIIPVSYRPFDIRYTVFNSNVAVHRRERVMQHMLMSNVAFHVCRQTSIESWRHVLVTKLVTDDCYVSNLTSERGYTIPLYLYLKNSTDRQDALLPAMTDQRVLNFAPEFFTDIEQRLGIQVTPTGVGKPSLSFAPEDVFHYLYAVLFSPTYRARYAEFLKIDFPRIPLTASRDLFRSLARLGGALVALHLVEFALEDEAGAPAGWPRYPRLAHFTGGDRTVDRFPGPDKTWAAGRVAINASSGFDGVPEAVWNFHIGGYQVCHKWLKDRKGRALSDEDVRHYAKIVTALHETMRIMGEIDAVIEEHGGWPGAFV